jgi:hypothetical protein
MWWYAHIDMHIISDHIFEWLGGVNSAHSRMWSLMSGMLSRCVHVSYRNHMHSRYRLGMSRNSGYADGSFTCTMYIYIHIYIYIIGRTPCSAAPTVTSNCFGYIMDCGNMIRGGDINSTHNIMDEFKWWGARLVQSPRRPLCTLIWTVLFHELIFS